MDLIILIGIAITLLVIMITMFLMQKRTNKEAQGQQQPQVQRVGRIVQDGAIPRRAQIIRNQRNRLRQNVAAQNLGQEDNNGSDDNDDDDGGDFPRNSAVLNEKMGAKKRAKLEAKEQKRLWREREMLDREELKVQEAKKEEEEKLAALLLAEKERKQAETERLEREERERKEYEEYMKMKAAFSIEEEGYEEPQDAEKENLLADFINYIKNNKVIVLEDIAVEFKLKTQQVIERIQDLQSNGTLTGVIDDRGKFIYISEEELLSVAKFIKQRGRVSIAELAESSNNLINLTPIAST